MNRPRIMSQPNYDLDTVYPWMRVVSVRQGIKETTVMRVWQLWIGSITNLKAKPGTDAAEFVTPNGILTDKGNTLIRALNAERQYYIRQKAE